MTKTLTDTAAPSLQQQHQPPPPTVSVVMTVYNTERYLAEAVDSILNGTFADLEFIIVDDGSTDGCPAILRDYERRDPRVRLVSRPNTGIVKAANEGIALARGRYLARMDSDDVSLPDRLAKQVAFLDAHPACVLLGTRVLEVDPYGSPVHESAQKLTHAEIDAQLLTCHGGWALVQPSVMMRTDALRAVGGYRGAYNVSEDHDLFVRLAERGEVANLPEPLLRYRRHYASVTHTQFGDRAKVKEQIIREAYARRGRPMPADWAYEAWAPQPQDEQVRHWGWAALKRGNVSVARKHATAAVRLSPLSLQSWRLLAVTLRRRNRSKSA